MKINQLFLILMLSPVIQVFGQSDDLYMPIEYRQAYENGTRKWDGTVSQSYFQNHTQYNIKAVVNPANRQVEAVADITYFNKSPHSLKSLVFHSYKDIYDEGMIIKNITVEGRPLDLKNKTQLRKSNTHYTIYLKDQALTPGDYINLQITWSITIPAEVDRDGAYDETSMLVAYWYPEIAVYDDVFGWDKIDFDGQAEFYHDVSDFTVEIEIPENFVVWASAAPSNSEEVYPKKISKRLEEANKSTNKVTIITPEEIEKGLKMKDNTWKYEAKQFPDFSFAFSDHYVWEACAYQDDNGTYFLNSAYPAENETFSLVLDTEKDALNTFHNVFPKYPFPFKHFVAFNGETGGGMEFAGMCNDQARKNYSTEGNKLSDYDANKLLTYHEMMHMYFPFLMGINEKRYGWMDEGMAEFVEDAFTEVDLTSYRSRMRFARSKNAPLMVETYTIPKTYSVNSYDISSQALYALMKLLGKPEFDRCLNGFMARWEHKHPTPYDFFFTFNELSGQNLNWFWKAWYFDWGYPDVAIQRFEEGLLTLKNIGGKPIALSLKIAYVDKTTKSITLSPALWKSENTYTLNLEKPEDIKSLELLTLNGPDAIPNNKWTIQ